MIFVRYELCWNILLFPCRIVDSIVECSRCSEEQMALTSIQAAHELLKCMESLVKGEGLSDLIVQEIHAQYKDDSGKSCAIFSLVWIQLGTFKDFFYVCLSPKWCQTMLWHREGRLFTHCLGQQPEQWLWPSFMTSQEFLAFFWR